MRLRKRMAVGAAVAVVAGLALASPAVAQDAPTIEGVGATLDTTIQSVNLLWIVLGAVLVIFMQAGFALVEAGLTRAKSVANIMMKNLMDFCAGAIAFWAFGFAFAYNGDTDGIGKFIGGGDWFLAPGSFAYGDLTPTVFFVFQVAFAATAATIVSGAMAERTKFKAYLVYSFVISLIIYPVVVRWQWGGGWLYQLDTPFHDFAGRRSCT